MKPLEELTKIKIIYVYLKSIYILNYLSIESNGHPIEESWILWFLWAGPKQGLQVPESLVDAGRFGGEPWHFPGMFA